MANNSAPTQPGKTARRLGYLQRVSQLFRIIIPGAFLLLILAFVYPYLFMPDIGSAPLPLRLLLAVAILAGPVWIGLGILRNQQTRRWPPIVAFVASLAILGFWLAHDDDTLLHEPDHPALRSDFAEAAATHALVLRYTATAPDSLHDTYRPADPAPPAPPASRPGDTSDWVSYVTTHRAQIETRWTELAPLRAWFDEMAVSPALADLTRGFDDPTPSFAPIREFSRVASERAILLALDGQGDAAIETLLPVLSASQKLQTHARTLVRRMIALSVQRQTLVALGIVLDQSQPGATTLARLADILREAQDPAEGARLLLLAEYHVQAAYFGKLDAQSALSHQPSPLSNQLRAISPLLYNPTATLNLSGDILHRQAELLARRDLPAAQVFNQAQIDNLTYRGPRKNLAGHLLVAMALPAFGKVAEHHWETQDWRRDLLARILPAQTD